MYGNEDLYEKLRVHPSASSEGIENAYRHLALMYRTKWAKLPGATEAMRQVTAAYEVLRDPVSRRAYDLQSANEQVQRYRERSLPVPQAIARHQRELTRPKAFWERNVLWLLVLVVIVLGFLVGKFGLPFADSRSCFEQFPNTQSADYRDCVEPDDARMR